MSKPQLPKMSHQTLLITSRVLRAQYREAVRSGTAKLDPAAYRKLDAAIKSMEAK